jgi:hypothetical protein
LPIVRSGELPPGSVPVTWVVADAELVNVWADLVPVTVALLLIVVPPAAETTPRIVTVQTPPPSIAPPLQVTWVLFCEHDPRLLTASRSGGLPNPTNPLYWSVSRRCSPAPLGRIITIVQDLRRSGPDRFADVAIDSDWPPSPEHGACERR